MKIIGHRGARGYAPEGTIASFKRALELGVDAIEFDVYALPSGEIIVMHDIMLDRTTNGTGYVVDMSFEELRKLDAGEGQQIPTLNEVIELVNRQVPIIIELKSENSGIPTAKLLNEYLAKGWEPEDFEVISFNHVELPPFHQLCPNVRFGGGLAHIPIDYCAFATQMNSQIVMLCGEFMTPEFVQDGHDRGITVYAYPWEPFTADSELDMKRIVALGIDGWVSDRPDVARSFLK
jgi:glycerophosphoryl diester phosphodiesterase